MKKLLILIILLTLALPTLVQARMNVGVLGGGVAAAAPAGGQAFSDNFTGSDAANPGANWTEYHGGHWQISSNQLYLNYQSVDECIIYTGQQLDGVTQYVKLKINHTLGLQVYTGGIFRWTNDSSIFYIVNFGYDGSKEAVSLWYVTDATFGTQAQIGASVAITVNSGDTFGITLAGTGATTRVRVWRNPTANTPVSATEWDSGDSTPDADMTLDASAHPADTGRYIGIYGYGSGSQYLLVDDFYGGDCP